MKYKLEYDAHIDSLTSSSVNSYKRINDTKKEAFYVYDAMVTAAQIHATLPDVEAGHVVAIYPVDPLPANFAILGAVHILKNTFDDWDTILHEYGHIVAQEAGFFDLDTNLLENGLHLNHSGGNLRDEYDHVCAIDINLAFSEGWANFYSVYAKSKGYTASYVTHKGSFVTRYSNGTIHQVINPNSNDFQGEDHEYAVMQLFWDLYDDDNAGELFDNIALGIDALYNLLRINPKYSVDDVWDYLSGTVSAGSNYLDEMTRYGKVFAEHGMGVKGLGINTEPFWQQGYGLPTFYWNNPKTSGGTFHLFDKYYVEFYDSQGNMITQSLLPIYSSANGPTASWTPTHLRWDIIISNPNVISDRKVYWVVRCSNNWPATVTHASATTGLYWSDQVGVINIF